MVAVNYFNQEVSTPNGIGIGEQHLYSNGEVRIIVRHKVKDLTGKEAGIFLTPLRTDEAGKVISITCLVHYDESEVRLRNGHHSKSGARS